MERKILAKDDKLKVGIDRWTTKKDSSIDANVMSHHLHRRDGLVVSH